MEGPTAADKTPNLARRYLPTAFFPFAWVALVAVYSRSKGEHKSVHAEGICRRLRVLVGTSPVGDREQQRDLLHCLQCIVLSVIPITA